MTAGANLFDDSDGLAKVTGEGSAGHRLRRPVGGGQPEDPRRAGRARPAVAPTPFTVSTEEYPFSRRLFLYVSEKFARSWRSASSTSPSPEGEGHRRVGLRALKIDAVRPPPRRDAPAAYVKATRGAHRLSFVFRFKSNGVALENRSVRDVGRLAAFVSTSERQGRSRCSPSRTRRGA